MHFNTEIINIHLLDRSTRENFFVLKNRMWRDTTRHNLASSGPKVGREGRQSAPKAELHPECAEGASGFMEFLKR